MKMARLFLSVLLVLCSLPVTPALASHLGDPGRPKYGHTEDWARGYDTGEINCQFPEKGNFPNLGAASPQFADGWNQGCAVGKNKRAYRVGREDGFQACKDKTTLQTPTGNAANSPHYVQGFLEGCKSVLKTPPPDDDSHQIILGDNPNLPVIERLTPSEGPHSGGNKVTITGRNLSKVFSVRFGWYGAVDFTADSDTQITAVAPGGSGNQTWQGTEIPLGGTGIVFVTVVNNAGMSRTGPQAAYSYFGARAPTITGLSTHSGQAAGGTRVLIQGTDFLGNVTVTFGDTPATTVQGTSTHLIELLTPPGQGTVDVRVLTRFGHSAPVPVGRFTYEPNVPPVITTLDPPGDLWTGGALIAITGSGFDRAGTSVSFGGVSATAVHVFSDDYLQAVAPPGSGPVDVQVRTAAGTSAPARFTYRPRSAPVVTGFWEPSGPPQGGNRVDIFGSGFLGATAVHFGDKPARLIYVNADNLVQAIAPPGSGTVNVTVTTPLGTSARGSANLYSYEAPVVTGISPGSGDKAGDTKVTITGRYLQFVRYVRFGSSYGTLTVKSDSEIEATAPAGGGTVHIVVESGAGASTPGDADLYTYIDPPPPPPTFRPDTAGPGEPVTLSGHASPNSYMSVYFYCDAGCGETHVGVARVDASGAWSLPFVVPANARPGQSHVLVGCDGCGNGWTQITGLTVTAPPPRPVLTAMSSRSGPAGGGTPVTITGTGFTGATAVSFGRTAAADFYVNSDTQITAVSPPGSDTVDVTVTTPGGSSAPRPAGRFAYEYERPAVTAVSPSSGLALDDTRVVISGRGFTGGTSVRFGSLPAFFQVDSDTQIIAIAPGGHGTVDVTVTTPGGTSATGSEDQYTYLGQEEVQGPSVTSVSPDGGPAAGGTEVTISGSGFIGATAVRFGAVAATSFTVSSDREIVAVAPAGSDTVDVTVTTPAGSSARGGSARFTYQVQGTLPAVTGLSPNSGPDYGDTQVIISGTGFTGAVDVRFGDSRAFFLVLSDTEIYAISPGGNGAVHVRVTTPAGTSPATDADRFSYR